MKKSFVFFVLLIVAGLTLSACSTSQFQPYQEGVREGYNKLCFEQDGLLNKDAKCVFPKSECLATESEAEKSVISNADPSCLEKAKSIGVPIGSPICNTPTNKAPAERMTSGDKIAFGSFTVDAETRVWILEKFVVPSTAGYAYDYSGREQNVLNAPFVVGSEMNPVNGKPFTICFDTTSNGCKPTVAIEFYK